MAEASAGFATKCLTHAVQEGGQASGTAGRRGSERRKAFSEDTLWAEGIGTEEAAGLQVQTDGKGGPGNISKHALIVAVAASGRFLASRTRYVGGSCSHHEGEASGISKDGPQIEGSWRWQ